jgi:hypothetical protein
MIELDGGQRLTALEQNRGAFAHSNGRIGERVWISWEPESAVIIGA